MSNTKVVTSEVRFSYCHVWEPSAVQEGQKPKYSVSVLIDKNDEALLAQIKEAIKAAYQSGVTGCFNGKKPAKGYWKNPLRDGDVERPDNEEYENMFFVNCSSLTQPEIIGPNFKPIVNQSEFYSGCYGRVSINFYPFNKNGGIGVAAGLNNLMKLRDGDSLGEAKTSAREDFGAPPSDAEDDFM